MASSLCWRCLSNASTQYPIHAAATRSRLSIHITFRAFSTTPSALLPQPPKKSTTGGKQIPQKGRKALVIGKPKRPPENRSRRPAPGERKAHRKRIVLSNVNAIKVSGMQDIDEENMFDRRLEGHVVGIPEALVDRLRAVEAFKPVQRWGLFWRPGTLMRRETVDMGKMIADVSSNDGSSRTVRRVLVGERRSGKSMVLLQALTMAMLKGWTVINLPEAQEITIGHTPYTPYTPFPSSSPVQYIQPAYFSRLLRQISNANPHLADIQLSQSQSTSSIPIPIAPNISLSRLATLGASDPEIAYQIFDLLITEILAPGRPPVFFGLDGLAHAMQPGTGYTAPNLKPIHPHDLTVLNWYLSFLSGKSDLPNGGIVMAATSQSNAPRAPALEVALSQLEGDYTTLAGQVVPKKEIVPLMRYDERVLETFSGGKSIEVQRLEGLSKEEARGLLEYWARSGMVRERISEGFVGEKWAMSGGGLVGELERAIVGMRA
ncbi:MAG: hypothetical protein Q9170_001332 [Blastenia crenularia]